MKVEKLDSLKFLFKDNLLNKTQEINPLFSVDNIEYQKNYRQDIISSENISFTIKNKDLKDFLVYTFKPIFNMVWESSEKNWPSDNIGR